MLKNLKRWWKEKHCEHTWRPAAFSENRKPYTPAKVCDNCEKVVSLTVPEFYAQFGRMPNLPAEW